MQLTGLIAAPHTPFNPDFTLNLEGVPRQARHLAASGVKGVFVAGTTGECHSLSFDERAELFAAWGEASRAHGMEFIAHTGHNSLSDARALAKAAREAGADAIGAMAPTFFKPNGVEGLIDWFERITEPAAALPFYFYDIPSMTGVSIDTRELVQSVGKRIPSFAGVKYTNPDRNQLSAILALDDHSPDMLWGCDEELLDGLQMGCRGAVGSSYNFAAGIYHRVIEAYELGDLDEAKHWQSRSLALIDILKASGYMSSAKAVMEMVGVDCGPPRPPLPQITNEERSALRVQLESLGFFEWLNECTEKS
ncbi:MAG: dihydrodipicolinate synthase family protein [Verrucomicrobiota bacterium]|nr:dihydrodipicolinate synthase family protein [Verrucomicrobiota bacterium]MEE2813434.1 dihydrodipicolinate synthase family protein [Verrucomicrobiota bacterium]